MSKIWGSYHKCRPFFGKKFRLEDAEITVTVPPIHPNCRCSIRPWDKEEDLTDEELGALKKYASSESYPINDTLHNGGDLGKYKDLVDTIDRALDKLPVYKNDKPLNRDLFLNKEAAKEFINNHPVGSKLNDKAYKSFSVGDYGEGQQNIRLILRNNKTGKDFIGISPENEQEILFGRETEFIVKSIVDKGNYTEMEVEEI